MLAVYSDLNQTKRIHVKPCNE